MLLDFSKIAKFSLQKWSHPPLFMGLRKLKWLVNCSGVIPSRAENRDLVRRREIEALELFGAYSMPGGREVIRAHDQLIALQSVTSYQKTSFPAPDSYNGKITHRPA